jgi:hypothetical protein
VGAAGPTVLDWAEDWGRVLQWAGEMRAFVAALAPGPGAALDLGVADLPRPDGRPLALPKVLSAAWLCRTGLDGGPLVDASSLDALAAAVLDACLVALPVPEGSPSRPAASRLSSR